jgi:D-ala-D-ala dipeptidase
MNDDLVFVDEFVSGIRWDAKYATWDNLVGKPVDGYLVHLRNTSIPLTKILQSISRFG